MTLEPGLRLGSYEVTAKIGEGGMGEVYRARDTKLNRDVALKVLPDLFASDTDRLARFQREAQVLASLNHPNIAQIYGIEESPSSGSRQASVRALVLELVEGSTLAERISKGPLPLDDALAIAKQIAEALEAAHEAGVIHRDLKPANIKVREDGTVKVLDFGLAKAFQPDAVDPNMSMSPTISLTAAATQMGMVIGTAAYMAPEQAKDKPVDKRADVWAFGAVLYEMLTGRKPFAGDDVSTTLARVIEREPDWDALPAGVPPVLTIFLHRCLAKDPKQRVHDVADVRLAMEGAFETKVVPPSESVGTASLRRVGAMTAVGIALATAGATAMAIWLLVSPEPTEPGPQRRFEIGLGPLSRMPGVGSFIEPALSPDGSRLVYAAVVEGGTTQLHVRSLDQTETRVLEGTENAYAPFFSPDGEWVAYFDRTAQELKKISVQGGQPLTLCEAFNHFGGTWLNDGIIFSSGEATIGLYRVPDSGGTPEAVTTPDESQQLHLWPHVLPGERAILYTVFPSTGNNIENGQVVVLSLETGEQRMLVEAGYGGLYAPSGHLVFARQTSLWAIPFDPEALETAGQAVVVLQGLVMGNNDPATFAVSEEGLAVYLPADPRTSVPEGAIPRSLVWLDEEGREEPLPLPVRQYAGPRLSPDGSRLAVSVFDGESWNLWAYDVSTGAALRMTQEAGARDMLPVWTPDGTRIIFHANNAENAALGDLYSVPADGSGSPERLTSVENAGDYATSVSPDGQTVIFTRILDPGSNLHREIMALPLGGEAHPVLDGNFSFGNASLSPDGNWLAYRSDETGDFEIYLQPYPGPGAKTPVSIGGGEGAIWSSDGTALYYRAGTKLMMVDIETRPSLTVGGSRELLDDDDYFRIDGGGGRQYHVAPDGRLLLIRVRDASDTDMEQAFHFVVVENWLQELAERVPVS